MKILVSLFAMMVMAFSHSTLHAEDTAPAMPDAEAMQKMMEAGMPGEHHKVLDAMVGSWTYTMTHRMAPDAPEETSEGTSENTWILGGRQVQQIVKSTMDFGGHKMEYEGLGYVGYDNMAKGYTSIWLDNMNTSFMVAKGGTYDEETKTIKEEGSFSCPMKGHDVGFRSEAHFIDEDHMTYTMYDLTSAKEPFKMMEIKYTRAKIIGASENRWAAFSRSPFLQILTSVPSPPHLGFCNQYHDPRRQCGCSSLSCRPSPRKMTPSLSGL